MKKATSLERVCSFPPVGNSKARILILGSMPGEVSLAENQYYAHPRNQFWPIMGELFGALPSLSYEKRLIKLKEAHVILWETLQSCVRPGSLDSDITEEIPNDFYAFLTQHPYITHIFFNGAKAEHSFRKYVLPALNRPDLVLMKLPSTSPAHAGVNLATKLAVWKKALEGIE